MHCPNEIKATVMQKIRQKIDILKPLEINDLDGLRLEFTGSWMLIRASGTEPAIRVLAESKGQAYTQELLNSGLSIVQNSLKEVLG
jgi:phosphoglucosamine mutase